VDNWTVIHWDSGCSAFGLDVELVLNLKLCSILDTIGFKKQEVD
jgi:hypothetical protein